MAKSKEQPTPTEFLETFKTYTTPDQIKLTKAIKEYMDEKTAEMKAQLTEYQNIESNVR